MMIIYFHKTLRPLRSTERTRVAIARRPSCLKIRKWTRHSSTPSVLDKLLVTWKTSTEITKLQNRRSDFQIAHIDHICVKVRPFVKQNDIAGMAGHCMPKFVKWRICTSRTLDMQWPALMKTTNSFLKCALFRNCAHVKMVKWAYSVDNTFICWMDSQWMFACTHVQRLWAFAQTPLYNTTSCDYVEGEI